MTFEIRVTDESYTTCVALKRANYKPDVTALAATIQQQTSH
jgi:hypothetical protein